MYSARYEQGSEQKFTTQIVILLEWIFFSHRVQYIIHLYYFDLNRPKYTKNWTKFYNRSLKRSMAE